MREIPLSDIALSDLEKEYDSFTDEMQKIFWCDQVNCMMEREGFDPANSVLILSTDFVREQEIPRDMLPNNVVVSAYLPKNSAYMMQRPKSLFAFLNQMSKLKGGSDGERDGEEGCVAGEGEGERGEAS